MKKFKKLNINKIKLYENNPRENGEAIEALVQSIKECGYISPIIVDEDYEILAGHTRYQALKRLGESEIDVIIIECLTEEQKKKYRLLDNRISDFSMWDFDKLDTELKLIDFDNYNFDFDDFIYTTPSNYELNDYELYDEEEDKTEEPKKSKPIKKKFYKCPECGCEFEV